MQEESELEKKIQQAKLEWDAGEPERKRAQQVLDRTRELDASFSRIKKDDQRPKLFQIGSWRTGKSLDQVREAIEAVGKSGKEGKISEVSIVNDHLITLKLGGLLPLVDWGRYTRIAVCEVESGHTEIRAKLFSFGPGEDGTAPDTNVERSRKLLEQLKNSVAAALDGNMK